MQPYIDISPLITPDIAVFPGDTSFSATVDLTIDQQCPVRLSHINTTVHLGAHADAPNHYDPNGEDISQRSLNYYLGACQVISIMKEAPNSLIELSDLANFEINSQRILFKTNSFGDPYHWRDDFCAISPEVIEYLAKNNAITIGIDTPSIDPANSKKLLAHQVIRQFNMAILEGLVLTDVIDGHYQLIALPLKISGADASPVRAILLPQK